MQISSKHLQAIIREELRRVITESSDEYITWAESEDVLASIDHYYRTCRDAAAELQKDLGECPGAKDKFVERCVAAVKRSIDESPKGTIF